MKWADAVPNLLIGLREGLEAGLVVSILLAALRKARPGGDRRVSSAPVWLGVLGAVMLAGSFAAVLTYSASALSSRAQEAVSGLLSVLAVGLVTGMVFVGLCTPEVRRGCRAARAPGRRDSRGPRRPRLASPHPACPPGQGLGPRPKLGSW